jgi:hypothetical protein
VSNKIVSIAEAVRASKVEKALFGDGDDLPRHKAQRNVGEVDHDLHEFVGLHQVLTPIWGAELRHVDQIPEVDKCQERNATERGRMEYVVDGKF